jgi:hypothetical protein
MHDLSLFWLGTLGNTIIKKYYDNTHMKNVACTYLSHMTHVDIVSLDIILELLDK